MARLGLLVCVLGSACSAGPGVQKQDVSGTGGAMDDGGGSTGAGDDGSTSTAESDTGTGGGPVECAGEVRIPDAGLAQALLDAQPGGAGSLHVDALELIEELDARERGIENIDGIQCATALRIIQLHDNAIVDAAPLGQLTAIEALYLDGNPLAALPDLLASGVENISVRDTEVTSVEPLRALESLRVLTLEGSPVADLEPIAGLPALWSLLLEGTAVTSLEALQDAPAITRLHARCLGLGNDAPGVVASWPAIADVDIGYNQVSDLVGLANTGPIGTLVLGNRSTGGFVPCEDRNRFESVAPLGMLELTGQSTLSLYYVGLDADDCPDLAAIEALGATVEMEAGLDCP